MAVQGSGRGFGPGFGPYAPGPLRTPPGIPVRCPAAASMRAAMRQLGHVPVSSRQVAHTDRPQSAHRATAGTFEWKKQSTRYPPSLCA